MKKNKNSTRLIKEMKRKKKTKQQQQKKRPVENNITVITKYFSTVSGVLFRASWGFSEIREHTPFTFKEHARDVIDQNLFFDNTS